MYLFNCLQFAFGANNIGPLSFFNCTGRNGRIGAAQAAYNIRYCQAITGEAFRVDDDFQLALGSAENVGATDARYALDPFLHDIFDEVTIGVHRALIAGQAGQHDPGNGIVF